MGYPNSKHIKDFVHGKVIDDIEQDEKGLVWIKFLDGEKLCLWANVRPVTQFKIEQIATPYRSNGEIKQSTEIASS